MTAKKRRIWRHDSGMRRKEEFWSRDSWLRSKEEFHHETHDFPCGHGAGTAVAFQCSDPFMSLKWPVTSCFHKQGAGTAVAFEGSGLCWWLKGLVTSCFDKRGAGTAVAFGCSDSFLLLKWPVTSCSHKQGAGTAVEFGLALVEYRQCIPPLNVVWHWQRTVSVIFCWMWIGVGGESLVSSSVCELALVENR